MTFNDVAFDFLHASDGRDRYAWIGVCRIRQGGDNKITEYLELL